jgi:hypothetical protein
MTATFTSVTPLVPAGARLEDALSFYVGQLGFQTVWQHESMAGVRRGDVAFNLVENDDPRWAENASFSIGVLGLDALHDEYRALPAPSRVGPLEMKAWGRREFHLIAPSGVCFQFYEKES